MQGESYDNALQAALARGNEPIVRLLLEKGANSMHRADTMAMRYRRL